MSERAVAEVKPHEVTLAKLTEVLVGFLSLSTKIFGKHIDQKTMRPSLRILPTFLFADHLAIRRLHNLRYRATRRHILENDILHRRR
jgi:hypothetical protein